MSDNIHPNMQLGSSDGLDLFDWNMYYAEPCGETAEDRRLGLCNCNQSEDVLEAGLTISESVVTLSPHLASPPVMPDLVNSTHVVSNEHTGLQALSASRDLERPFQCDFEGCKSKGFIRVGDLNRHKKKHDDVSLFCTAIDCTRNKGFYRADKLGDHIMHGHDWNTLFKCPNPNCVDPPMTRNLRYFHGLGHCFSIENYRLHVQALRRRHCPIPGCPYEVQWHMASPPGYVSNQLDLLKSHLLEHDTGIRRNFENLLADHGYDAVTGDISCPVCKKPDTNHLFFWCHLLSDHFGKIREADALSENLAKRWYGPVFRDCKELDEKAFLGRRTILNLCPSFYTCGLALKDLEKPGV